MDSAIAYFKGFLFMQDDEHEDVDDHHEHQPADIVEHDPIQTPINNNISGHDDDLEIGRNRTRSSRRTPNSRKSSSAASTASSSTSVAGASTKEQPRMMSFLTDIFWTKAENNNEGNVKGGVSSASSSMGHIVGIEQTSKSYNSDTSSTQSSSDQDRDHQQRERERHWRRGRSHTRRTTRREFLAMMSEDSSSSPSSSSQHLPPLPHVQLLAHGKLWTTIGILATWMGFALSYHAWISTAFVSLQLPFYVDPVWDEVTEIGMINLKLCYNTTHDSSHDGCTIHQLTSQEIDDTMFQTARSMSFLAVLLGGFLSIFLTSGFFWRSINLRPVGLGYLLTYFMQSFTFLFFDADLCTDHECSIAAGGKLSAVASLCWIVACIAAARMDSYKFQKTLEWVEENRELNLVLSASRSRSRSNSPQKKSSSSSPRRKSTLNKKTLQRRTTEGTAPLSDDSFDSSDDIVEDDAEDVEICIETSRKGSCHKSSRSSSSHSGRRFASNGCEIIQGIQDRQAAKAWAARSPKAQVPSSTSSKKTSSSAKTQVRSNRRNRPNLTIDTSDANESYMGSHMSSTITSVGSPILPPRRTHVAIRRPDSPSKRASPSFSASVRLDHSGQQRHSPTKPRPSPRCSPSNSGTPTSQDAVFAEEASPSSTKSNSKKDTIERQLDELDALVQRATPRLAWDSPASSSPASRSGKMDRSSSKRRQRAEPSNGHASPGGSSSGRSQSRQRHHSKTRREITPSPISSSPSSSQQRRSVVFDFLEDSERRPRRSPSKSRAQAYCSPKTTTPF